MNKKLIFIFTIYIIFALLINLAAPIETDTAWIMNIIDFYVAKHIFYNSAFGVQGGWGNIFIALNGYIVSFLGNFYLNYWLFGLVYSLVGVCCFYKLLTARFGDRADILLAGVGSYILLAFGSLFFVTTRAENIYVSSIAIVLYLVNRFFERFEYRWVYLAALVSTIAALSHPNGLLAYVFLFVLAIMLIINRQINYIHLIIIACVSLAVFLKMLLFGQSFDNFIASFNSVMSDGGHKDPFYHEPIRYIRFVWQSPLVSPIFLVGLIAGFLNIKKFFNKQNDNFESYVSICFIIVAAYLTFIVGAKGPFYVSLLFPFVAYFIASTDGLNKHSLTIISVVVISMASILLNNIKKNEEFINLVNIPSERATLFKQTVHQIEYSRILAPMRFYAANKKIELFEPFEGIAGRAVDFKNIEYVVMEAGKDKDIAQLLKKLNIELIYEKSFRYNDYAYVLFKIKSEKLKNE